MIIDASVAVKWLIPEEGSEQALSLLGNEEMIVPQLLHCEVANAIWKHARRGDIRPTEVIEQMPLIKRLTRTVDDSNYAKRAVELAIELSHPAYDCLYLAIAEHLRDVVVTADRKFLKAVAATRYSERVRQLTAE